MEEFHLVDQTAVLVVDLGLPHDDIVFCEVGVL